MADVFSKYRDDVTSVFGIGIEVLNGARSLQTISMDLQLLAYNGIVQASRVGSEQGKSLITLSGFLSSLPREIAPELSDLEKLSRQFATQITICSIAVRRFILYALSLQRIFDKLKTENNLKYSYSFDISKPNEIYSILKNELFNSLDNSLTKNLNNLADKVIHNIKTVNELLIASQRIMSQFKSKIERIKRNGFIANYMGSNISIESAYLSGKEKNFQGLVLNIKEMVVNLNNNLDGIMRKIDEGDRLLLSLLKSNNVR